MRFEIFFFPIKGNTRNGIYELFDKHGNSKKAQEGCHFLFPVNKIDRPFIDQSGWNYSAKQLTLDSLHGPACLLANKVIVYPCQGQRCVIVCPCNICDYLDTRNNESLTLQEQFLDHEIHHQAPHSACVFCDQFLSFFPAFNYERVIQTYYNSYKVKTFSFRHSYCEERRAKSEKFKCDLCEQTFSKVSQKKRHFDKVHYGGKYRCEVCEKRFTREDSMKRHTKLIHEHTEPEFSCNWCHSKFKLHADLVKHKKVGVDENGEIKNQCKDCQKIYCIQIDLQRHRKMAHKRFKCDNCEKEFSTKYNLNIHKENTQSSCDLCSSLFCTKSGLLKHTKIVHKE